MADRSVLVKLSMDASNYLKGATQATVATKGIGTTGTTASNELGKSSVLMAAKFAAAGVVVGKFLKDSVQAAIEAESAETKLAYAYGKFPALADVSLKSLNDLAEATQRKTVFDHESTQAAIGQLAAYKLTGTQVETLIPLVQDLAARQGVDLATATDSVGRALLGQGRGLKTVGIAFKDTGTLAGNFAELQQGLNDKVGGFADVQGKTAAGQAARLKNEYKDLQETVGKALLPVLSKLVGGLDEVVGVFNSAPGPIKDTVVVVGLVAGGAVLAAKGVTVLQGSLATLGITSKATAPALAATAGAEDAVGVSAVAASSKVGALGGLLSKFSVILGGAILLGQASNKTGISKMFSFDTTGPDKFVADAHKINDALLTISQAGAHPVGFEGWYNSVQDGSARVLQALSFNIKGPSDAAKSSINELIKHIGDLAHHGNITEATAAMQLLNDHAAQVGMTTKQLADQFPGYAAAVAAVGGASAVAATDMQDMADRGSEAIAAIKAGGGPLRAAATALSMMNVAAADATAALFGLYHEQIHNALTADQWKDSLVNLTATIKGNGKTLDDNTVKGRANRDAILNQVDALLTNTDAAVANAQKTSAGMDKIAPKYQAQWKAIETAGIKAGLSKAQVDHLIGAYQQVPASVTTVINQVAIDAALQKARDLRTLYQQLGVAVVHAGGKQGQASQGGKAFGGIVPNIGQPHADGIVMNLSGGEGVLQAPAMKALGTDNFRAINSGQMPNLGKSVKIESGAVQVTVGDNAGVSQSQVQALVDAGFDNLVRELNAA